MITTVVLSAQPGRAEFAELVDLNHPGQDGHRLDRHRHEVVAGDNLVAI